jgi:WD40-like Beta Propeller Repeat
MRVNLSCIAWAVVGAAFALFAWCDVVRAATYAGFTDPQTVTIQGYSASAMEPSISPDGQYLLFNSSNVSPSVPSLLFATRATGGAFTYQGEILGEGVNEADALSATPSLDQDGDMYFISTRSYPQTLSTVYAGRFSLGWVSGVHLVAGVSGGAPGVVDFDVAVSPDGDTLYVSVGDFDGGSAPTSASLVMYDRVAGGFVRDPSSVKLLHSVNKAGYLDYAASVSSNGLELFFTRADPARGVAPAIYRASRKSTGKHFAHAQRIAAITGFAEAPSISADASTLYYHKLVGGQFEIQTVTRP